MKNTSSLVQLFTTVEYRASIKERGINAIKVEKNINMISTLL